MHDEKVQPVVGNSIGHLSTGPKLHLNASQASFVGKSVSISMVQGDMQQSCSCVASDMDVVVAASSAGTPPKLSLGETQRPFGLFWHSILYFIMMIQLVLACISR